VANDAQTRWAHRAGLVLACVALGAGGGCRGEIGSAAGGPGVHPLPPASVVCRNAAPQPGPSPLRRLTRAEYDYTVADLLGDTTAPGAQLPDEEIALAFTNNADAQSVSGLLIEGYENAAIALATAATADLPRLLGCDPAARGEEVCVREFLPRFGRRAFRRPLDAGEVDRLLAFYTASKQTDDFATAVRMTVQAMLQMPSFLYRVESNGAQTVGKPGAYEMASRLSYLLWSSMPDAPLLDAAGSGGLDTAAGVLQQARRLLADPRSGRAVHSFFGQWLDLDRIAKAEKDATLFPRFTADVRRLLRTETTLFTDDVVFGGRGMSDLLLGSYTFMNKDLAAFYGKPGPTGAAFEKVALDPARQAGILTQAGLLAATAKVNQTSPVARGLFVRERLLCNPPPPPPANVNATPPAPDPTLTTRERFARHRADAACAGCHALMDPLGLGFEHFDGQGLWRDTDAGHAVDATGQITATTDINGPFDGAVDLARKLSSSADVEGCMVKQWFRFGYGRSEGDADQCTLQALGQAFHGKDFQQLLLALTQSDTFLYRTNEQGGAP